MNPLTNMKNLNKMNERELALGYTGTTNSWHDQFRDSAWIFIGGLDFKLSEGDIICVFSQYGEVVNINLVRDNKTGKSKGYAFLCYEDQRSTILAVDNFNGATLAKRPMRVDHCNEYRPPKERKDAVETEDGIDLKRELKTRGCGPDVADELRELEKKKAQIEALLSKEDTTGERERSRENRGGQGVQSNRRNNDQGFQPRRENDQMYHSKKEIYPSKRENDQDQFKQDSDQGHHQSRRNNDQGYQSRRDEDQWYQSRKDNSSSYPSRREEGPNFHSRRDEGQVFMKREGSFQGRHGDSTSNFYPRRDNAQGFRRDNAYSSGGRDRGRFPIRGGGGIGKREGRAGWNSSAPFNGQKPRNAFGRQQRGNGGSRGGFRDNSSGVPRQTFNDRRYNDGDQRMWSKEHRRSQDFQTVGSVQRSSRMGPSGNRHQERRHRSRS